METNEKAQKIIKCSPDILLRGSIFVIVSRIILIVVLFSTLRLFIRIPFVMFEINSETILQMFSVNTIIALISVLVEIALVLFVTLTWVHEHYEIMPGQIIRRRGVLVVKENVFTFDRIQTIDIFQGLMGKIFNFGSLTIYNPALDRKIILYNIDNPVRYKDVIEQVLNVNEVGTKSNLEHNTVYVRSDQTSLQ